MYQIEVLFKTESKTYLMSYLKLPQCFICHICSTSVPLYMYAILCYVFVFEEQIMQVVFEVANLWSNLHVLLFVCLRSEAGAGQEVLKHW